MADEHIRYWTAVARKYDRVVDLQIGGRTRSLICERLGREDRLGDVVEFGCGTGFYTAVLAEKADRCLATDASPGMLDVARERITAPNVAFRVENCERTSLPDAACDTAFMSLVIHFTDPPRTLAEMRRILRPGGTLILTNLDPGALVGLHRIRCWLRILFHGITGYRVKPPSRFGRNVLSEQQALALLDDAGFIVLTSETIRDDTRSSSVPVEYIRASRRP
jgi:ABC-2 type transport system ATP-binding protein